VEQLKYLEHPEIIKILFRKKLRADLSPGLLAIIRCGIFVFQFAIQKYKD
jgi:hypothetical protein